MISKLTLFYHYKLSFCKENTNTLCKLSTLVAVVINIDSLSHCLHAYEH